MERSIAAMGAAAAGPKAASEYRAKKSAGRREEFQGKLARAVREGDAVRVLH